MSALLDCADYRDWIEEEHLQILIDREYCSRSLINFVECAWHQVEPPSQPFIKGWAVEAICEHYEAITKGQIKRLLVETPPGLMKSLISQVFFPAFEWGPAGMPYLRILSASFSEVNAMRDNRRTRMLIESDWYQKRWPLKMTTDQNTKGYFENEKKGFRQCSPVGSMTGKRGDRVNWDDPISIFDSKSKVEIEKANMIFSEVLSSRLNNPDKSSISIIMQRAAKNDVASKAREQGYDCLTLPMEFESKRKCITSIGFEDPRKEDGELLFPERFSREFVETQKIILPEAAYAAQMQQRPTAEGGGLIKVKEFQRYKTLPQLICRCLSIDSAMKEKESSDYTVMQCWGLSNEHKLYLIDQIREKMTGPKLKSNFLSFWTKHKQMNHPLYQSFNPRMYGPLSAAYIEDKASGTGLIQEVELMGGIPVEGIIPERDKYTRVYLITPIINAGMIYLHEAAEFLHDFIDECESFTDNDTHPNDDQIDGMVMAINKMIVENPIPWWQQVRG